MFYPWTIFAFTAPLLGIGVIAYHAREGTLLVGRGVTIAGAAFMLAVTPAAPQIRHEVWVEHSYCDRITYVINQDHCPVNQRTGLYPGEAAPDYAVTQDDPAAPISQ
jgi:hypothetical protein